MRAPPPARGSDKTSRALLAGYPRLSEMPARREATYCWLAGVNPSLSALLKPYPAERMRVYPVAPRVNSVKNDDGGLIEPALAEGGVRV